jgi:hypothetical protein
MISGNKSLIVLVYGSPDTIKVLFWKEAYAILELCCTFRSLEMKNSVVVHEEVNLVDANLLSSYFFDQSLDNLITTSLML